MTFEELLERANCRIIGIDDQGNISGGYDDGFPQAGLDLEYAAVCCKPGDLLSKADRLKLADYMIGRWSDYRAKVAEWP